MSTEWYSDWFGTKYYKMLYGHRDNSEARALAQAILGHLQLVKEAKVWDMACGRGRHLFWFNEAGMLTYGSDLSENSVREASQNVPTATLRVHDMRGAVPFPGMDLTVNLFTSMGYFEDSTDDLRVFERAYASVNKGGHFVLDFLNAETLASNLIAQNEQRIGALRFISKRSISEGAIQKRITVVDGHEEFHFLEKVRAYQPQELQGMIEQVGFKIEGTFGKDMGEPLQGSERCVIMARKE